MNQLSWLIYLADVANSAQGWINVLGFLFGVAGVVSLILLVAMSVFWDPTRNDSGYKIVSETEVEANRAAKKTATGGARAMVWLCLPIGLMCIFASIAIPSRDTIYAIAASELGERALSTPLVGKMGDALEAWLDRQISPSKSAAPKAPPSEAE